MNLPLDETDFGVTLAKWGLPEGPYLVLPFVGSTTMRDVWRLPVDQYFDPLQLVRERRTTSSTTPSTCRASSISSRCVRAASRPKSLLEGVYDPYVFYRDAYRQRRLYEIYDGQPPADVIEQMQGATDDVDVDKLLDEQHQYEKQQQKQPPPKEQPKPQHG